MNVLIKAKDIYAEYMGRDILNIEELTLYDYDRIGLVGANGAGKSTLLKMLLGETPLSSGLVDRHGEFAYIPQLDDAILQEVMDYALLGKLGVDRLRLEGMSGGEETRMKIAQALSSGAHGMLADEPTSHLDRAGIDFLIGQLRHYAGALLIISHDRYFLDKVVDKIWELRDGKITEYWGGYSDYLTQKEEERQAQETEYKKYTAERERLEKAIAEKKSLARKMDQKAKGSAKKNASESGGRLSHQKTIGSKQKKLHQAAQNMEHRIEALGELKLPESIRNVQFRQSSLLTLHNPFPIMGMGLNMRFGDKVIFSNASFQFPLGAKIGITGANGAGKTTLFKMIIDRAEGITLSPKAEIGYFAQSGYKFDRNQGVMEYMLENSEYQASEIRSALASMGFSQQDVRKELTMLSGGEIMKLQLTRLLFGRYNILLLDEPGNFLDIHAVEALEDMMKCYKGTVVFITHDAQLLKRAADMIYEVKDGQIIRMD